MAKKTIQDLKDIKGKRVLIRVDFNVPLDSVGHITNDRRIRATMPTIRFVLEAGASAIVMSHLGRPQADPGKNKLLTMDRVAERLSQLLKRPVKKSPEVAGPETARLAKELRPGEVLLLENLRFDPREQKGDSTFARGIADLGDAYVNDAFGACHRSDASMVAVPAAMAGKPRVVGFLVAKELNILEKLLTAPPRPFLAILGGAKVSDKIGFIKSLLSRVDRVVIGGAMSYTFLKSQGRPIGNSKVEGDKLDVARDLLKQGKDKIALPLDHLVVEKLEQPGGARVVDEDIPAGLIGVDIGPKTIARYTDEIERAAMTVWNGPMGKFEDEPYRAGTLAVARAMAASQGTTIVGGGETAEAVEEFGLADKMTHVSTGGGAFLEFVEGNSFAALDQIDDKS